MIDKCRRAIRGEQLILASIDAVGFYSHRFSM
jgi:hypothetical protein